LFGEGGWFLDQVATHIFTTPHEGHAFEGDSEVVWYEGNGEAYHEIRWKKLGDKAAQPHRVKYRPLGR